VARRGGAVWSVEREVAVVHVRVLLVVRRQRREDCMREKEGVVEVANLRGVR